MDPQKCECDNPGFCLRYNKQMTNRTHQICKGEVLTPEKCEAYRKRWLSQRKTGLGDVIHKVTHATGLDKVAQKVAGWMGKKDCGCAERRKTLNKIRINKKRNPNEARMKRKKK